MAEQWRRPKIGAMLSDISSRRLAMIAETSSTAERLSEPLSEQSLPRTDRPVSPPTDQEERTEFVRQFEDAQVTAGWRELLVSTGALLAWFALFAGGTLIATKPYIDALGSVANPLYMTGNWCVIVLFWTITNVGILSMLAAILGAFGQRTRFASPIRT